MAGWGTLTIPERGNSACAFRVEPRGMEARYLRLGSARAWRGWLLADATGMGAALPERGLL